MRGSADGTEMRGSGGHDCQQAPDRRRDGVATGAGWCGVAGGRCHEGAGRRHRQLNEEKIGWTILTRLAQGGGVNVQMKSMFSSTANKSEAIAGGWPKIEPVPNDRSQTRPIAVPGALSRTSEGLHLPRYLPSAAHRNCAGTPSSRKGLGVMRSWCRKTKSCSGRVRKEETSQP